ncbi:MAG: penicillin-binding transpeptidase domain-containing protein [Chitinophagaceae bacterium]
MRNLLILVAGIIIVFAACTPNSVTEDKSLKVYFDSAGVTGTFGMFDNAQATYTIYDLQRFRDSAYLPASTFKIVNSLIGLQTGRVIDSSTVIPWDGITRSIPEWNQNLSMNQAFHYSAVPWYQELARRIGKDTMQKWLDTLGYAAVKKGGRAVINKVDTFWLDNSIKITPDEQLGFLKRLYFEQLPFFNRTQEIVISMMLQEDKPEYKLSYKTGWAHASNRHSIGWINGWIEENHRPYFFVLLLDSPDENFNMQAVRLKILKQILAKHGFMLGKK